MQAEFFSYILVSDEDILIGVFKFESLPGTVYAEACVTVLDINVQNCEKVTKVEKAQSY